MSVTSSVTFGMVENSCSTPSIRIDEIAAPGIEDSNVRRREFPIVYPKPGSSGSMMNFERISERVSSWIVGLATMSNCIYLPGGGSSIPPRRSGLPAG